MLTSGHLPYHVRFTIASTFETEFRANRAGRRCDGKRAVRAAIGRAATNGADKDSGDRCLRIDGSRTGEQNDHDIVDRHGNCWTFESDTTDEAELAEWNMRSVGISSVFILCFFRVFSAPCNESEVQIFAVISGALVRLDLAPFSYVCC